MKQLHSNLKFGSWEKKGKKKKVDNNTTILEILSILIFIKKKNQTPFGMEEEDIGTKIVKNSCEELACNPC